MHRAPATSPEPLRSTPDPLRREDFAAACTGLAPELRRACRRLGIPDADVDDVVQESLLRAWAFRRTFQRGTNFRAWLHRVLRNAALSRHRRRRRERDGLDRLRLEPSLPRAAELRLLGPDDALLAALEALPAEFRAAVDLVDVQGLAYREAAEALGCPVGTVMSRLHRARRALRAALAPSLPAAA